MAVSAEEFACKAIAGSGLRSRRNRPVSSAAMCCASAAEPPFPARSSFPPAAKDARIISAALATSGASRGSALATSRCSFQMALILSSCWPGIAALVLLALTSLSICCFLGVSVSRPGSFSPIHCLIPPPDQGCLELGKRHLCPFSSFPSKHRFHPGVLPAKPRLVHATVELLCQILQLCHEIRPLGIKILIPSLQVVETSLPDALTVFERTQILDVQTHRKQ